MNTRLIKSFAPYKDESGLGFYRRLSADNGLSGWSELARLAEVSASRSGLFSHPEHIASMLGLDSAACQMASAREEITMGWRAMRRTGFDAVCPHCLKQSVHLRLGWDHAYMVACPTHKSLLVDKCGGCGERLSDKRAEIDICPCGFHLPSSTTRPATAAQLWVANLISSQGETSGCATPSVSGVHLDLFSQQVRNLCQLHDPTLVVTREKAAAPKTIAEAVAFLTPMESLLHDWPKGFESHVRDRIASGPVQARTLNTKLGKWYSRLRDVGLEPSVNPFVETVHRLAEAEYSEVLALDHLAAPGGRDTTHLMLPEAAARIGVHRDTLVKAIHAGVVKCKLRPYANRGLAREVPSFEVEALIQARSGWMSEAEARELLGVPESVFKYMTSAGLVTPDYSARQDIWRGAPVQAAALMELKAKLMSAPLRASHPGGATLLLKDFNARHLGDRQAIVRLFKAILSGDILATSRGRSVGELEYLVADISTVVASRAVDAGLTIQALSRVTGWKWESIDHWIETGLLDADAAVLRGQPCKVVHPEHLFRFMSSYLPLSSIADALGTRSSDLLERLGSIELVGGKTLPSGVQRGALVRLTDLAGAALRSPHGKRI